MFSEHGFLTMDAFVTIYNYTGFRLLAPPYSLSFFGDNATRTDFRRRGVMLGTFSAFQLIPNLSYSRGFSE